MTNKCCALVFCGMVSLLFQSIPAAAQLDLGEVLNNAAKKLGITQEDNVRETNIDLSVPISPAFTALGVTPNNVIRPASPREFAASILNGADPNGNFQTGFALETAPYLLVAGDSLTLRAYQNNHIKRLLARTQISLATTKGTDDDDKSSRVALGVTITPWDEGDPRRNEALLKCFGTNSNFEKTTRRKMVAEFLDKVTIWARADPQMSNEDMIKKIESDPGYKKVEAVASKHFKDCRKEHLDPEKYWNNSSWSIGVAPTWLSSTGRINDLQWSGAAVWSSVALGFGFDDPGFENFGQMILHGRYRAKEQFPNPVVDGGLIEQDTWLVGGQLRITGWNFKLFNGAKRIGGPDLNFQLDVSYRGEDRQGFKNEKIFRYTAGAELKLTDGVFLNLSVGAEDGGGPGQDQAFTLANLKWAFSEEPTKFVQP